MHESARFELSCSVHRLRAVECSLRTFHWVRWRISGASQARRPRVSVEEMRHPVALRSQPNAISLRVPQRWLACRHRYFALSIRCVGAGRMPRRQPRCSLLGSFASPAKSSSEATAVWALPSPPRLLRLGLVSPVASAPIGSFDVAHAHQGERNARPRTGCLCRSQPALCVHHSVSISQRLCVTIRSRAENYTHTHLNHTHI